MLAFWEIWRHQNFILRLHNWPLAFCCFSHFLSYRFWLWSNKNKYLELPWHYTLKFLKQLPMITMYWVYGWQLIPNVLTLIQRSNRHKNVRNHEKSKSLRFFPKSKKIIFVLIYLIGWQPFSAGRAFNKNQPAKFGVTNFDRILTQKCSSKFGIFEEVLMNFRRTKRKV